MSADQVRAGVVTDNHPGDRFDIRRTVRVAFTWQVLGVVAWALPPFARFLNISLCGSLVLSLLAEPSAGRFGRSLLFGTGFALLWVAAHASAIGPVFQPVFLGALLGLGALAELSLHPTRHPVVAAGAFGLPCFVFIAALFLISTGSGNPVTQDAVLLAADRALGGLPSYAIAGVLATYPTLWALVGMAYNWLPLELALVLLVAVRRALPDMRPGLILYACGLAGVLGAAAYWFCPATGPRYAFAGFPTVRPGVLPLAAIPVAPQFPRNAMPSLHFTWAWLLWRAARPVSWLHHLTLAWLMAIAIATLAFGEHYVIDLVVAAPFAATIEAVVAQAGWLRISTGLLTTIAWLLILRGDSGLSTPVAWAALLSTVAVSGWAAPRLPFAARPSAGQST